jgi:hypothetical protein
VPSIGLDAGQDTLKATGSLAGRVRLEGGDEVRTVLILALGTNTLTVPGDTSGRFVLDNLAAGEYRVRFLSTLSDYKPHDTVFTIRSGFDDTLPAPVRLASKAVPAIAGAQAKWLGSAQAVELTWLPADPARVAGYNVYRAPKGLPLGGVPINPTPLTATTYRDTDVVLGKEYAYAIMGVDRNGNSGTAFSATVFAAVEAEYALSKTLLPGEWTHDNAPLAVAGGEIYWLSAGRVDVLDTATGALKRSFGNTGAEPLANGTVIRILRDTVYVVDLLDTSGLDPKFGAADLKRYNRAGAYLGKRSLAGIVSDPVDIQAGPGGSILLTDGRMIYALRAGGKVDSAESPLDEGILRNMFAKLEGAGDSILIQGSYRQMPGDIRRTQWAWLGPDLTVKSKGMGEYFLNAYSVGPDGSRWEVRDDSLARQTGADGSEQRRIRLPAALYRDILFSDGVLYLYDYSKSSVALFRKP